MSKPDGAAVPKFSSFRPKPIPGKNAAEEKTSRERIKRTASRERKRDKDRLRKRRGEVSEDRGTKWTHRDRDEGRRRDAPDAAPRPAHEDKAQVDGAEGLFFVDRRGDPKNLSYGSLHRYDVPSYFRAGSGSVLGLKRSLKIDATASTDGRAIIEEERRTRSMRHLLKRQREIRNVRLVRLVSPSDNFDQFGVAESFVALQPSRERKRNSESPEPGHADYRSIEGRAKDDQPADTDMEYVSDSAGEREPDLDLHVRRRNAELVQRTKEHPADLDPWLDLIAHQAMIVRPGVDSSSLTNMERRTLADMRLSLYETALRSVRGESVVLLQGMLDEGALIWDSQKRTQKWQEALQANPTSARLWTKYLDYIQSNPITFRFESCKLAFVECLRNLQISSLSASGARKDQVRDVQLYVLLRMTRFIQEAGYEELAIALWQALIEYHILRPGELMAQERQASLEAFEVFWESEVPRFGEERALGWGKSVDEEQEPPSQVAARARSLDARRPFKSFAENEESSTAVTPFPGRTTDESEVDDPYHVIFFSDVREVLELTAESFSARALLGAFLCFCGLPPLSTTDSTAKYWSADSFLRNPIVRVTEQTLLPHYQTDTAMLFSTAFFDWPCSDWLSTFARRGLMLLVDAHPDDDDVAEYQLALEAHVDATAAFKVARSLLKKRPSSLRLYNACALIEVKRERSDRASHVWRTAVDLSSGFTQREDIILLYQSSVWHDLLGNKPQSALSWLVEAFGDSVRDHRSSADGTISLASKLRSMRVLKDGFDRSLTNSTQHAALYAECLALLAYLTEAEPLRSAIESFNAQSRAAMTKSTVQAELIHQAKVRLLRYHIQQQRPYQPAYVRAELEESLKLFPNNTFILQMHSHNEVRHRLEDRVRALLKERLSEKASVIEWAFAVSEELRRYKHHASGSTAESVRTTFSAALLSAASPVQHSPYLWKLWFSFEKRVVQQTSSERQFRGAMQQLRQVFLDGLRNLPWLKGWVLEGLKTFDGLPDVGLSQREMRKVFEVLGEKELRVRFEGLEDLLDSLASESLGDKR
ncbi:hypothetical protein H2203_002044 [Taxawa tesnikishii (nom. ined.)]|nr:hypothetical protein H2203_002044 [Dothideales sp. JES 119]